MRVLAAAFLASLISTTAIGEEAGESRCAVPSFRSELINDLLQWYAGVTKDIELVPPSEAAYLQHEIDLVLENKPESTAERFQIAATTKFFRTYEVQRSYNGIVAKLKDALTSYSPKYQVSRLTEAMALTPILVENIQEYIAFDRKRPGRILDDYKELGIKHVLRYAPSRTTGVIKCLVSQMKDP